MEVTALNEKNVNDLSERLGPLVTGFYKSSSTAAGAAVFRACGEPEFVKVFEASGSYAAG